MGDFLFDSGRLPPPQEPACTSHPGQRLDPAPQLPGDRANRTQVVRWCLRLRKSWRFRYASGTRCSSPPASRRSFRSGHCPSPALSVRAPAEYVEIVLSGYEPFPALAVDRHWTLVSANRAVTALMTGADPSLIQPPINVLRLSLHPLGLASANCEPCGVARATWSPG